MEQMNRRDFMGAVAAAAVGAVAARRVIADAPVAVATRPAKILQASDTITLGRTGVKTSRLAIGTGTVGGRLQRKLGDDGMIRLFRHALDGGVRWWDAADSYGSHGYVAKALKEVDRDDVVITSKTWPRVKGGEALRSPEEIRGDIERFRKELGTDYIDIVLLHCLTDGNWREKMRGHMDVLSELKQKGWIRAVGCSCHSFEALQAAAEEPWVEIDLARINPFAKVMDVGEATEVPRVEKVLQTMHNRGKAVYGMKIVGEGALKGEQIDRSLQFALSKPYISGFTIGFGNQDELDDMVRRIERLRVKA